MHEEINFLKTLQDIVANIKDGSADKGDYSGSH
jgi:hypothetical protein